MARRNELSIVRKGLLAALLPIILQFVLIANLSVLLRQADLDNRLARESARMREQGHQLSDSLLLSLAFLQRYLNTGRDADLKGYDDSSSKLRAQLTAPAAQVVTLEENELSTIAQQLMDDLDKQKQQIRSIYFRLNELREIANKNRETAASALSAENLNGRILSLSSAMQDRIVKFEAQTVALQKIQVQSRRVLNMYLIAAVALNFVIAVILASVFILGLTRRLTMLNDNIQRFSQGMPISEPRLGGDEIGRLDSAFHGLAKQLLEAQRLKQEFVSMVTHDLKTPLTSIHLFHQLLRNQAFGELPENAQVPLQSAERSTDRLLRLVNGLLDIEKLAAGQLKLHYVATNTSSIINQSIESIDEFAKEKQITISRPQDDFEVVADAERIVQVLVNLLGNAIKFSPENSSIQVNVSNAGGEDSLEFEVLDSGCGIPVDQQASVFERYRQIESAEQSTNDGTGLGLSICKGIVEAHNGAIGAESRPSGGSRFWFRIPVKTRIN